MKQIKEYLNNQKDLALMMMSNEMGNESGVNLVLVKHWLERATVIEQLLKELDV